MAAVDYAALLSGTVALFKTALPDVYVSDDPEAPPQDNLPAVLLDIGGFDRVATRMARFGGGSPYTETVTITATCLTFSGQGARAARNLRDALVKRVVAVIDQNPGLNGMVLLADCLRGDFTSQPSPTGGGIFAGGRLAIVCQLVS